MQELRELARRERERALRNAREPWDEQTEATWHQSAALWATVEMQAMVIQAALDEQGDV